MATRLSRRQLMGAAVASSALTLIGCARPLPEALLGRTRLRIRMVGFPPELSGVLSALMEACRIAYERARRGAPELTVSTSLVPDSAWYRCSHCQSDDLPASPAPPITNGIQLDEPQIAQIGRDGIGTLEVRGRTRLDIKFGNGNIVQLPETINAIDMPDSIVAYDLWQYWLTPLAADISETWKTVADDRVGVQAFERYARFFSASRGTFAAAFPIVRNPMVIVNSGAASPWQWSTIAQDLQRRTADTSLFRQSLLYPEATELAASLVVAFGGTVGRADPAVCQKAFSLPQASRGVTFDVGLLRAPPRPGSLPPQLPGFDSVFPAYMWNPLGGVRADFGLPSSHFWPLPSGPVRDAAPCTYLCATVVGTGKNVPKALDFASFLMNPSSQTVLGAWDGGLPLRQTQALSIIRNRFPWLTMSLAARLASASADLTAEDVFGGDETVANAASYDAVADAFASAVAQAQAARG